MAAVHILSLGEVAGFKIVPFIATHVKMKNFFHGAMNFFSASQNSSICMKTTDIKLFLNNTTYVGIYLHVHWQKVYNINTLKNGIKQKTKEAVI